MYAQFTYSAFFMAFGATLLALGFWRRVPFLRWQALVLMAVTIGKVFLVDVSPLSQGFRIISFLGLGALLLAVSFIYQRDWLNLRSPEGPASETPGRIHRPVRNHRHDSRDSLFSLHTTVENTQQPAQTCVSLDSGLFAHAAPGLADLRLYGDRRETPYLIQASSPATTANAQSVEPLNLGLRGGVTVFDAAMPTRQL